MKQVWVTVASQKVNMPDVFEVEDIEQLSREVQALADGYIATEEHPPLGPLTFQYELDDDDHIGFMKVYFHNKHGRKTRFARLERE